MDDYKDYISICQELDLFTILKDISLYNRRPGQSLGSDRLTGAQIESLVENLRPQIHQDRFQNL